MAKNKNKFIFWNQLILGSFVAVQLTFLISKGLVSYTSVTTVHD